MAMEAQVGFSYRPPGDADGADRAGVECAEGCCEDICDGRLPTVGDDVAATMGLSPPLTNRNAYIASTARIIASARRQT